MINKIRNWYMDRRDSQLPRYIPYVSGAFFEGTRVGKKYVNGEVHYTYKGVLVLSDGRRGVRWENPYLSMSTKANIMRIIWNASYQENKHEHQIELAKQNKLKKEAATIND